MYDEDDFFGDFDDILSAEELRDKEKEIKKQEIEAEKLMEKKP